MNPEQRHLAEKWQAAVDTYWEAHERYFPVGGRRGQMVRAANTTFTRAASNKLDRLWENAGTARSDYVASYLE